MKKAKLPLPQLHIDLRSIYEKMLNPVIASVMGLLLANLVLILTGYNPAIAMRALIIGSFGSQFAIASTLSRAVPIMFTGLAFAVAARAKLFNIGTEGQFYLGAITAVILGYYIKVFSILHIFLIMIVAFIVGALWALPAAVLKVYRGVNEVISTIMLNWIAYYLLMYLVLDVFYDPAYPYKSVRINSSAEFPLLIPKTDLTYAIFVSILVAIIIYVYMWLTVEGYELRAVGLNETAAKYAGINVKLVTLKAMLISGGLAGLGGAVHVMSLTKFINATLTNVINFGFDGITVSLLGRNHPIGIIFSAIFLGALRAANPVMQIQAGVPKEIVIIMQGIIILFIAIPSLIDLVMKKKIVLEEIEEG